ncbi:porin [Neiella marina]|uniref:Porin n=1 Tax=Neiella holothuriorum TaxID=2870530 RepID=A0ABS7EK24_9GAMM|nr:porin [Neiella holothuriorum]MBW8192707.1 porin [Neiella holothuriorum]
MKTLCSALMLMSPLAVAAQADLMPTVYGKINVTVQSTDEGSSTTEVKSHHSRFGLKGVAPVNDDLSAVYLLEFKVNIDEDEDNIKARNQYVGLRSKKMGELLLGRKDSAFKTAQGKIDRFGDINGDIAGLFAGENRVEESLHYTSPKWGKAQFAATYILEGNSKQSDASDNGASSDAFSLAVSYGDKGWKNGNWYASAAYDAEVFGVTSFRVAAYGQWADIQLGAMYQDSESDRSDKVDQDGDGYLFNAGYKASDDLLFKVQYQDSDMDLAGKGSAGEAINVGVDYKLAKSTTLYAFGTSFDLDAEEKNDDEYFGVGLIHLF